MIVSGFVSLALLCMHWRAERPMPSAANLSPVAAGERAYRCAPFREGGKRFLPPCSPSALLTGNLKVGTVAPENTASSSVDTNFRCVLVATKFSLLSHAGLLGS